jgi:transposase
MRQGCLVRGETLEMWVMDEHRIGLKPLLRRIWATRGQRPIVRIQPRYQWLYLYAFAHPNTGRSFYLLMPTVSIVAFSIALSEFATFVGASTQRQILILLDKAGWHVSPDVERPTGVGLRFLPAYSPELQPAEHLWQLTDVPLVNRWFATLDDLESALAQRCSWLQDQFDLVRSTTRFHWWPALV